MKIEKIAGKSKHNPYLIEELAKLRDQDNTYASIYRGEILNDLRLATLPRKYLAARELLRIERDKRTRMQRAQQLLELKPTVQLGYLTDYMTIKIPGFKDKASSGEWESRLETSPGEHPLLRVNWYAADEMGEPRVQTILNRDELTYETKEAIDIFNRGNRLPSVISWARKSRQFTVFEWNAERQGMPNVLYPVENQLAVASAIEDTVAAFCWLFHDGTAANSIYA